MASTSEDLARLLVQIELSQAKTEKQAANIAKAAERAAKKIDGDFKAANNNVGRSFQQGSQKATASLGQSRAAVSQLSFQLNDIAMGLASGTSPFTIMVQQGSQVTQALAMTGGGAGGAVKALGGAFASMINPVSLATFAIIGLGGAAVQYFASMLSDGEKSEKTLREQAKLIEAVAQKWGDAVPALKAYVDELERARDQAELAQAVDIAIDDQYKRARGELAKLTVSFSDFTQTLMDMGVEAEVIAELQRRFKELDADLENSTAQGQQAKDIFLGLNDIFKHTGIDGLDVLAEGFRKLGLEIDTAANKAQELQNTTLKLFGGNGRSSRGFIPLPDNAPAPDRRVDPYFDDPTSGAASRAIKDAARAAQEATDKVNAAVANQTAVAVDAVTLLLGKHEKANTGDINAFLKAGGVDLNAATTAWCAAFVNSALAQVGIQGTGSNVATDFLNFGKGVDASQVQRGDVLVQPRGNAAGQTGGHVGFATGLVRFQEGILQLQMISGNASDKVQEDWVNASDVVARRATEAFAVPADALKHIGQQSEAAKQAALDHAAAVKQQEQAYQQLGNIATSALNGIANALADGKIEGEELLQIVLQIVQQLLTMPAMGGGGLGGGGSLIGSLLGGIFGFAKGTRYAPGGAAIVGERGPELVNLPRGSQVIPNHNLRGMAGNSQQAVHVTVGVSADANGNLMPFVESVSQRTAASTTRQGIAAYDKQLNRSIGGKVANWQTRAG